MGRLSRSSLLGLAGLKVGKVIPNGKQNKSKDQQPNEFIEIGTISSDGSSAPLVQPSGGSQRGGPPAYCDVQLETPHSGRLCCLTDALREILVTSLLSIPFSKLLENPVSPSFIRHKFLLLGRLVSCR